MTKYARWRWRVLTRAFLIFAASLWLVAGGTATLSSQQPQSGRPKFRAGVDVIALDVSVLDKDGKPVHGLVASDFTVHEDRESRPLVDVSEILIPVPETDLADWTREVGSDVTGNRLRDGRLLVIIMDDATAPLDPWVLKKAKEAATLVVDHLGPDDVAAILFPRECFNSQGFTNDRVKLRRAIETFSPGFAPMGQSMWNAFPVRTLEDTSTLLSEVPDRRKSIIYISPGNAPTASDRRNWETPSEDILGLYVPPVDARSPKSAIVARPLPAINAAPDLSTVVASVGSLPPRLLEGAMLSNVAVYAVSPLGLGMNSRQNDFLRTISELTGGFAVVDTNDIRPGIERIFEETNSYYLLGYQTRFPHDGRFHWVDVRVNRPGVTTQARNGYWAPSAKAQNRGTGADSTTLQSLDTAIAEVLPQSDLALEATVSPFWSSGLPHASVAVAQGLRIEPAAADGRDTIEMQARVFTVDGKPVSAQQMSMRLTQSRGQASVYDALWRLDLKPGRYELRLSAHSTASKRDGSVYVDIDIPDFAKQPLSLSGLVVGTSSAPATASKDAVATLVPVVPTSVRAFARSDRVAIFMRVYQGQAPLVNDVTVTTRIIDTRNHLVAETPQAIAAGRFAGARPSAADYSFDLPLVQLPAGEYLLQTTAAGGGKTARRDLRFSVQR